VRDEQTYTAIVDAAGAAQISITPAGPAGRQTWTVDQITTELIGSRTAAATCMARLQGKLIDRMSPWGDVLTDPPPVTLRPGNTITLTWAGMTPGDTLNATAFYDDGQG
jgi:hypothetical protein